MARLKSHLRSQVSCCSFECITRVRGQIILSLAPLKRRVTTRVRGEHVVQHLELISLRALLLCALSGSGLNLNASAVNQRRAQLFKGTTCCGLNAAFAFRLAVGVALPGGRQWTEAAPPQNTWSTCVGGGFGSWVLLKLS